jgi:diguanylate cyclase (GGDEF)-like protein/PAS domain S-box-containing protein
VVKEFRYPHEGWSLRVALQRLVRSLPEGRGLDEEMWRRRHRVVVGILFAHVPALMLFGMLRGYGVAHSILETAGLSAFAIVAAQPRGGRRIRSVVASVGLMACSALLVHMWNGTIEAHFHFFVMVALLSVYQDWVPFLIALGFVVVHHGVVGALQPSAVYDHADAISNPWVWALIHGGFVLAAAAANTYGWLASEHDHRRAAAAMSRSEQAFRALFERNPQPMWVVDVDSFAILAVNRAAVDAYGYSQSDFLAMRMSDVRAGDDAADALAPRSRAGGDDAGPTQLHHTSSGRVIKVVEHEERLSFQGHEAWVVVATDLTERIALEDELRHRAFHDALTGLGNRALFRDRLEHALARQHRSRAALAVLSIDLDDFKTVNDVHGHVTGDRLLVEIGARLRTVVRPEDTVARMGGDEFALLLEGIDVGEACAVADRVLTALRQPLLIDDTDSATTASIGIAVAHGQLDATALLQRADIAMYEAKASGKGRSEVFRAGMQSRVLLRTEMAADMRLAVERGELYLDYQPIIDLGSDSIQGVEALLRWRHPVRGLVGPVEFIPVAEETGAIVDIGLWVLREACRQVREWDGTLELSAPLRLSVNVSPRQLRESSFVRSVIDVLEAAGLESTRLTLEVTEGAMVEDMGQARGCLTELRTAGVRIAIDDFGTGYSSIGYLRSLPLDEIKIDRMFVPGLAAGEGRDLVLALVRLVDTLGVPTVVEGIETSQELDYVRALGVGRGQGYHFSRPVAPEAMAALLTSSEGISAAKLTSVAL